MGSTTAIPKSWSPYNNYKDCSTRICSIYCPQWCYVVFPPPPPFSGDDDSGSNFSPLIISIIGILSSALLLIAYYTLISKYCKRRQSNGRGEIHHEPEPTELSHIHHHDQSDGPAAAASEQPAGLDQSLIESITVCSFYKKKKDGLAEEGTTECAVCLGEFQENEKLRLLPKCGHAFHLSCIDMWLKSHSNCPLCRANVGSSGLSVVSSSSMLRVQGSMDLVVVVVEDPVPETGYRTEGIVENMLLRGEDFEKLRTSLIPIGSFQHGRNLLVSDILRSSEEEEEEGEIEMGIERLPVEIGSSRGICEEIGMEMERLNCRRHDNKGKNTVIPD